MKKIVLIFSLLATSVFSGEIKFSMTEAAMEALHALKNTYSAEDVFSVDLQLSIPKEQTLAEALENLSLEETLHISTSGEGLFFPCELRTDHEVYKISENTVTIDASKVKWHYITLTFIPKPGFEELPLPAPGMMILLKNRRDIEIDYRPDQGFFYN